LYNFGGIIAARARTEYQAVTKKEMERDTASASLMENEALLRTCGVAYDQNNRPVIDALTYYDTHYIRFNLMRTYV